MDIKVIKVPDIRPEEVGYPANWCFKQTFRTMERCTKGKGHELRGDPNHSWGREDDQ